MTTPYRIGFAHRANGDGTYDSICRACFQTVGTVSREADLDKPEQDHQCDQQLLDRFRITRLLLDRLNRPPD